MHRERVASAGIGGIQFKTMSRLATCLIKACKIFLDDTAPLYSLCKKNLRVR